MFNDQLLAGRRILVTGGGTGLGKSMAAQFLQLGAEVHICGRRKSVCDETATELMDLHGGRVVSHGVDIRNALAVDEMIEAIWTGGPSPISSTTPPAISSRASEELSPRGFDAVANIVMHGTFYVTHAVGRRWIAAKQRGNVVSITVTWVRNGSPYVVPSAMSKSAIHAMTMSLAIEWGKLRHPPQHHRARRNPDRGHEQAHQARRRGRRAHQGAETRWAASAPWRSCRTLRCS